MLLFIAGCYTYVSAAAICWLPRAVGEIYQLQRLHLSLGFGAGALRRPIVPNVRIVLHFRPALVPTRSVSPLLAQMDRAPGFEPGGWRFQPLEAGHPIKRASCRCSAPSAIIAG